MNRNTNPFNIAIDNIFSLPEFLDECVINGELHACIVTKQDLSIIYTEAGTVEEAPFTIFIKLPIEPPPKVGDKVFYNDQTFKISAIEKDSICGSMTLHLVTTSKGV